MKQPLEQYLNMIGVGGTPNGLAALFKSFICKMCEPECYSALMTTLSAIIVEMGTVKESIANLAPNAIPSVKPITNNTHSASINSFVYSAELKVRATPPDIDQYFRAPTRQIL